MRGRSSLERLFRDTDIGVDSTLCYFQAVPSFREKVLFSERIVAWLQLWRQLVFYRQGQFMMEWRPKFSFQKGIHSRKWRGHGDLPTRGLTSITTQQTTHSPANLTAR